MNRYDALLACYRSGQMSEAQMQEHMRDDAVFAAYVKKALAAIEAEIQPLVDADIG